MAGLLSALRQSALCHGRRLSTQRVEELRQQRGFPFRVSRWRAAKKATGPRRADLFLPLPRRRAGDGRLSNKHASHLFFLRTNLEGRLWLDLVAWPRRECVSTSARTSLRGQRAEENGGESALSAERHLASFSHVLAASKILVFFHARSSLGMTWGLSLGSLPPFHCGVVRLAEGAAAGRVLISSFRRDPSDCVLCF